MATTVQQSFREFAGRLDGSYLVRHGYFDTRGRLGFSFGTPLGMRFAKFHEPNSRAGEDW